MEQKVLCADLGNVRKPMSVGANFNIAVYGYCLQRHIALETNVNKWQCKQLGIPLQPAALGTGATHSLVCWICSHLLPLGIMGSPLTLAMNFCRSWSMAAQTQIGLAT